MLGGASGRALVLDAGQYFRENLLTAERKQLPPIAGEPMCAVPVPGTINVVLVTAEGDRRFAQLV